jgi:hypothetical protein
VHEDAISRGFESSGFVHVFIIGDDGAKSR